jgi:hypothetical protein
MSISRSGGIANSSRNPLSVSVYSSDHNFSTSALTPHMSVDRIATGYTVAPDKTSSGCAINMLAMPGAQSRTTCGYQHVRVAAQQF